MELLKSTASKFIPAILQIWVWSVPKTSYVNGNLSIKGGYKDLHKFRVLMRVVTMIEPSISENLAKMTKSLHEQDHPRLKTSLWYL